MQELIPLKGMARNNRTKERPGGSRNPDQLTQKKPTFLRPTLTQTGTGKHQKALGKIGGYQVKANIFRV